ncbi:MAG: 3-keto-5-aminohexanoate cleavage enzyme [Pseudohongiellaceae bacterium]|jgi:3-keto-5-aminohexanoate cleavage enzyme
MHTEMPVMIAVAPNGARKTQKDHPNLPLTPKELANTAKACNEAGAVMLHLHVRDKNQQHTLAPHYYRPALKAVKNAVGDEMIIQITTEAVGSYQPQEQIATVKALKPAAVSLALREILPEPSFDREAGKFLEWMYRERVSPQFILYSVEDIQQFIALQIRGLIQSDTPNVLLVLGKYSAGQESIPDDLQPLINQLPRSVHWWLCAFGKSESVCMAAAMDKGGHCRVGFENNLQDSEGELAIDNASQVDVIARQAQSLSRGLATLEQAKRMMEVR